MLSQTINGGGMSLIGLMVGLQFELVITGMQCLHLLVQPSRAGGEVYIKVVHQDSKILPIYLLDTVISSEVRKVGIDQHIPDLS